MRSAAYSLFTSLLLLVPICAVPLMAVFGVPQFTPAVTSPLDDSEEDDWDRPPRKRPARAKPVESFAEQDLEISDDEAWNWDDAPPKRPAPLKKPRPTAQAAREKSSGQESKSLFAKNRGGKSASATNPGKRPAPLQIPEDVLDEGSPIQQVGFDDADEERPFVTTADQVEEVDEFAANTDSVPQTIPGYRRPRPNTDEVPDKNSPRTKRTANVTEALTWKKAVDRLNELGIRVFRLEPGVKPGEFTFTCSYTPSQTPHVTRKFEAEADDPLKAVAQVLTQVERWAQQRDAESPRRLPDQRDSRNE